MDRFEKKAQEVWENLRPGDHFPSKIAAALREVAKEAFDAGYQENRGAVDTWIRDKAFERWVEERQPNIANSLSREDRAAADDAVGRPRDFKPFPFKKEQQS